MKLLRAVLQGSVVPGSVNFGNQWRPGDNEENGSASDGGVPDDEVAH